MSWVGVDGCKAGWFFIALGDSGHTSGVVPDASTLLELHSSAELILIDIPIGLRSEGKMERLCDLEARKVLGPKRSSSVFPAPSRPALSCTTYEEANSLNRGLTGRGLSKQSWAIAPKILEVDLLLRERPEARGVFREVHPEICFWALAGGVSMQHNKKTDAGVEERFEVLRAVFPRTDLVVSETGQSLPPGVGRDDLLDALCCVVTGFLGRGSLQTIPAIPEIDERGLQMEMVFVDPKQLPRIGPGNA